MIPFQSLSTVSYSHFIAAMAVSLGVSEIFSVKEWCDREILVWGRSSTSLKMAPFDRTLYDFLLVGHCKHGSVLYHFRDKEIKILVENRVFIPPAFDAPVRGVAVGILPYHLVWKKLE